MIIAANLKFACLKCQRGHRAHTCSHVERPLFPLHPGSDRDLQTPDVYGNDKIELRLSNNSILIVNKTVNVPETIALLRVPGGCSLTVHITSKEGTVSDTLIPAHLVGMDAFQQSRMEPGRKKRPRAPNTQPSPQSELGKSPPVSAPVVPPSHPTSSSQILRPILPISSSLPSVTSSSKPPIHRHSPNLFGDATRFSSEPREVSPLNASPMPSPGVSSSSGTPQLDALDMLAQMPFIPHESMHGDGNLADRRASALVDAAIQIETADAMRNLALNQGQVFPVRRGSFSSSSRTSPSNQAPNNHNGLYSFGNQSSLTSSINIDFDDTASSIGSIAPPPTLPPTIPSVPLQHHQQALRKRQRVEENAPNLVGARLHRAPSDPITSDFTKMGQHILPTTTIASPFQYNPSSSTNTVAAVASNSTSLLLGGMDHSVVSHHFVTPNHQRPIINHNHFHNANGFQRSFSGSAAVAQPPPRHIPLSHSLLHGLDQRYSPPIVPSSSMPSHSLASSHGTFVMTETYNDTVKTVMMGIKDKYPNYETDKRQRELMFEEVALHLAAYEMTPSQNPPRQHSM
ncbi:hypothetical protein BC829DRAFT_394713 [Chytridium lagenaria]|nr:hypothetical protein BC829DRAFT_394713 [Chytridium lagenaria]